MRDPHDTAQSTYDAAVQQEFDSQAALDDQQKLLDEATSQLPDPGKEKLAELKKQIEIVNKPRGKGKARAQRDIDKLVDDQNLELQDVYTLLTSRPDLVQNLKQDKAAAAKALTELNKHKSKVQAKKTAIGDLTNQNEQLTKLTKLEMLKVLSTAHSQGLTLEAPQVKTALSGIQQAAVPEAAQGFSVIRPVREFFGTVRNAFRPSSSSAQPQPTKPPAPASGNPGDSSGDPQGGTVPGAGDSGAVVPDGSAPLPSTGDAPNGNTPTDPGDVPDGSKTPQS